MTETTQNPGTEVARRPSAPAVSIGTRISTLDQAVELSKTLAHSSLVPDGLRGNAPNILVMIMYGQDIGLSPMQAIQGGVYVVKGKPLLAAQTWMALARRAGHRVSVIEHTAEACTVEIVRGDSGEKHRETFTMDDARTAKLDSNDNYRKHPKRMLLARAVSNGCRFLCPEIALGFYAEGEEFGDNPHTPVEVDQPIEADTDIADAEIVDPAKADAEVAALAEQFNFATPAPAAPAEPEPEPAYGCEACGPLSNHTEDNCPKATEGAGDAR